MNEYLIQKSDTSYLTIVADDVLILLKRYYGIKCSHILSEKDMSNRLKEIFNSTNEIDEILKKFNKTIKDKDKITKIQLIDKTICEDNTVYSCCNCLHYAFCEIFEYNNNDKMSACPLFCDKSFCDESILNKITEEINTERNNLNNE